jgi:hypothetical protein
MIPLGTLCASSHLIQTFVDPGFDVCATICTFLSFFFRERRAENVTLWLVVLESLYPAVGAPKWVIDNPGTKRVTDGKVDGRT